MADNQFLVEFSMFHPRFPAHCYHLMLALNRSVLDGFSTLVALQKTLVSIFSVRIFQIPFVSNTTQRYFALFTKYTFRPPSVR